MAKAPPAATPAGPEPHLANADFHHPPTSMGDRAPDPRELHHLRDLLPLPVGGPGTAPSGAPAQPTARRADPPPAQPGKAVLHAVLAVHEAARPALRLRPQLPEQHPG